MLKTPFLNPLHTFYQTKATNKHITKPFLTILKQKTPIKIRTTKILNVKTIHSSRKINPKKTLFYQKKSVPLN